MTGHQNTKGRFHEAALRITTTGSRSFITRKSQKRPLPSVNFARTLRVALWTGCGCRSLCSAREHKLCRFGGKNTGFTVDRVIGLCRKQVEGEKPGFAAVRRSRLCVTGIAGVIVAKYQ